MHVQVVMLWWHFLSVWWKYLENVDFHFHCEICAVNSKHIIIEDFFDFVAKYNFEEFI